MFNAFSKKKEEKRQIMRRRHTESIIFLVVWHKRCCKLANICNSKINRATLSIVCIVCVYYLFLTKSDMILFFSHCQIVEFHITSLSFYCWFFAIARLSLLKNLANLYLIALEIVFMFHLCCDDATSQFVKFVEKMSVKIMFVACFAFMSLVYSKLFES